MAQRRTLRSGAALCALAIAAGFAPFSAPAVAQTRAQEGGRIAQIVVQGNQRIEESTIRSYLTVAPGDPFRLADIDRSLKTLFATGLFADAEFARVGDTLVIAVLENPIVNRVAFEGNRRLDNDELDAEVQLRPRVVFTPAKAKADAQRLIELYRQSGRFAATVEPKIVELPQNRVDLVFEIEEGDVTGVGRINFLGNEIFSDSLLRGVIATKESRLYRFFTANDNYDPNRLEFDREQLRQYYRARGYADFTTVSAIAELTPDQSEFYITFIVEEGPLYTFGSIEVETELDRLNSDVLKRLVATREGEVFNGDLIEESIDSLTFAAGANGYAFVDIQPLFQRNEQDQTIGLTFRVREGARVYIDRIDIEGNVSTLDRVIRREMQIVEGDAFNRILVDRSRRRVRGLGFFEDVEIEELPSGAPDRTTLRVKVTEQSTGELSLGAGFSSTDAFLLDFAISQRNFLGRGQFLRFRVSLSNRRRIFELRFSEPYFLNRRLGAGFDIFRTRIDFSDVNNFETSSTGASLRTGFPLAIDTNLALRYTIRSDDVNRLGNQCDVDTLEVLGGEANPLLFDADFDGDVDTNDLPIICNEEGSRLASIIGYTLTVDRRNDPIRPSRGWIAQWSQDFAGAGGSVRFIRTQLNANWFRNLFRNDIIFSLGADLGYIQDFGDSVRVSDRFIRGAESFRGFEPGGVGPRDTFELYNDILGGDTVAIGRAEVTFPLGLPDSFGVRGGVFADVGTVGLLDPDLTGLRENIEGQFALRASVGVSVFWRSPFGPIRIDLAQPLAREDFDQLEQFRFGASTAF